MPSETPVSELLPTASAAIDRHRRNGMEGEVELEESLLEAISLPTTPMPSTSPRKSINWASPLATSVQTICVKRSSTRFSGKSANYNETVLSSEDERPVCVITRPETRRRGRPRKHKESLAASPSEPQEESKSCSIQDAPLSHLRKRARRTKGEASHELDGELDMIQTEKGWISVPLDSMEGADTDHAYETQDRGLHTEANETSNSLRSLADEAATKITNLEVHRNVAFCGFNTAWQESPELSKTTSHVGKDVTDYQKLCESLAGARKAVHEQERQIHELLSDQLEVLQKQNTRIAETAAREQERLRHEISECSQTNSRILKEKFAVERDRDFQCNNFLQTLEASRESLRLEMERKHNQIVADLTEELGKERDKSICQICFCRPRDAIILPCTHFEYCSECLREVKGSCPTCRAKINGVLRCNLCMS